MRIMEYHPFLQSLSLVELAWLIPHCAITAGKNVEIDTYMLNLFRRSCRPWWKPPQEAAQVCLLIRVNSNCPMASHMSWLGSSEHRSHKSWMAQVNPCSSTILPGVVNILETVFLPKLIYRFNAPFFKISVTFLQKLTGWSKKSHKNAKTQNRKNDFSK